MRELALLPGDNVGMAFWVNNLGQAVSVTGTCANTTLPPLSVGYHAVLWERDGRAVDLGNLGGTGDPAQPGVGNVAHAINDLGQAVGMSALASNTADHGFIWTRARGMRSLDPLPWFPQSGAASINNRGDVVGVSFDGMLWDAVQEGNAAAVVWRDGGAPTDLNELVAAPTPLYLLFAFDINDAGEIVGIAFGTDSGKAHGFLGTPVRAAEPEPGRRWAPARRPPRARRSRSGGSGSGHTRSDSFFPVRQPAHAFAAVRGKTNLTPVFAREPVLG